jgi:gamma-glutamylcyclotransferase (GGCT)/AIG2-like uncharacterized protein YtfP
MDVLAGIRLFVYGSLLRGERHHDVLAGATFVREALTTPGFAIYDLGDYPALVRAEDGVVAGELYDVSESLLAALDAFEGEAYERAQVSLDAGEAAEAYVRPGPMPDGATRIPSGSWKTARPGLR